MTAIEGFTEESKFLAMLTNLCYRPQVNSATCSSCCSLYPFPLSLSSPICSLLTLSLSLSSFSILSSTLYCDHLPNANIVEEFCRWKSKWLLVPREDHPKTLTESMKNCCSKTFLNIFTLLQLFSTLPLSSCSCEWSVSALKRLNN